MINLKAKVKVKESLTSVISCEICGEEQVNYYLNKTHTCIHMRYAHVKFDGIIGYINGNPIRFSDLKTKFY